MSNGSEKCPLGTDKFVAVLSDRITYVGHAMGSAGLDGVGKIMSTWTSVGPSKFDSGSVMATGPDLTKNDGVSYVASGHTL